MVKDYYSLKNHANLIILDNIDSTNTFIADRIRKEPPSSGVISVVADHQSSGRGRYERSFYSPSGTGIYLSYAFKSNLQDAEIPKVTPVVATVAHRILSPLSDSPLRIKWVNDLYNSSGKVSGILTEMIPLADQRWIVIGIGVNVSNPDVSKSDLQGVMGHLSEAPLSRSEIVSSLLDAFESIFAQDTVNLPCEQNYYRNNCLSIGTDLIIKPHGSSEYKAHSIDIDDSYALIVRPEGENDTITVFSGEVSTSV